MRGAWLVPALVAAGCASSPAATFEPAPTAASPSPAPSPSILTAGDRDPDAPLQFPRPDPLSDLQPKVACVGQDMALKATRLPPGARIAVWFKDFTLGGWKVGNPSRPEAYGARRLGEAEVDASGAMAFSFVFTRELAAMQGPTERFEIWLVYPEVDGKTPIRPTAATFAICDSDRRAPAAPEPTAAPAR